MRDGQLATSSLAALQQEYLRGGATERSQVITLTDEEIVAVDLNTQSVVPLYWYSAQSPKDQRLARAVASRGLVARGWADADSMTTSVDNLALTPTEPLLAVLELRRQSTLIVLAEQKSTVETRARAYYLQGDGTALEEAVNSGGLHRFSTLPETAAIEELALWCDPAVSDEPDKPWATPVADQMELEAVVAASLLDTRVVTILAAVSASAEPPIERYLTVYVSDDRLSVCGLESDELWARDVSHQGLTDRIAAMIQ
jgi:hypothetical protein